MTDLKTRFRSYDTVRPPEYWLDALARAEAEPEPSAAPPRRWLLPVALVLLLVGLVGGAILFSSGVIPVPGPSETPGPTSSPSATASPSLAPTPAPSTPAGPIEVAWEPVAELEPGARVGGITFVDGRWFLLGGLEPSPGNLDAAIWTSNDGRTWTRASIDAVQRENEYSVVRDMVAIGDALVAIGSWGAMDSDQSAWVTWRSTDGGDTWTEDREHAVFPGALQAITPGGAGLVAFGSTFSGVTPYDSLPVDSPDGIEWQATGASLANSAVLATAALGDRIVAVGMAWPSPEDLVFEPAAWYSDDGGETWASGNLPGTGAEESIFDVTAFQGGLVAIGYGEAAVSWTTVDGATWERFEVASSARSMAIGAVDDGLVAVGNLASSAGSIGQGSTWTSGDARAWFDGPALGDGSVAFSAVAGNADLVLAGGRCQAASCATVLWRGEVIR